MATPIKPTPILEGDDAERFLREVEENEDKKVPREEIERALETYKRITERQTK